MTQKRMESGQIPLLTAIIQRFCPPMPLRMPELVILRGL